QHCRLEHIHLDILRSSPNVAPSNDAFKNSVRNKAMGQRPLHVKPPAYLSESPPVPEPKEVAHVPLPDAERPDPVRYGDWELKGIAVDF
ncbi:MAG: hypothetical protein RL209_216, partial [Pseudomonadota bacterium]